LAGLVYFWQSIHRLMVNKYTIQINILLKRLLILVFTFQLCRLTFLMSNYNYFAILSFSDLLYGFFVGIRFDLSSILMVNIPFAFFHLLPIQLFFHRLTQKVLGYFFFITNIPFILLNCIDLEYFKFQGKRTTADLFQLFGMGDDMKNTIPKMAADFWYVIVIFSIISIMLVVLYKMVKVPENRQAYRKKKLNWVLVIPFTALLLVGARGGFQYKPLGIMSAARLASPQLVPLVLNTPFTVIRTFGKSLIEEKNYFPSSEAIKYYNKEHTYHSSQPFKPLNVVVIILESFSSEYIGAFNNGEGYTPFLDSLMHEGMTFSNAFANAKKSIDGIPAVVASMPSVMSASYISSPYNSNKLYSIAGILGTKGYSSAFFHGGNNGTMNFDNFTLMTGFEKYYGRKEYPGDDYDGQWGVFDEQFYYFFIKKCNEMKKPFVNSFFSLSSHHPYAMPEKLKNTFKKGELPIHESIGYADYALKCFFEKAKETSWYKNTLFVITADHTGPAAKAYYNTKSGMFRVPILFFHPGSNLKGFSSRVTQQTDILPGILDYLHFDQTFSAFGQSMFDTINTPYAINYPGDIYQISGDSLLVQFDGNDVLATYNYRSDSLLQNNIYNANDAEQFKLTLILKSFLQQFNSALIRNELAPVSSMK
jgi:phosphoglycerol transferase MdoB-like AlkP superfamily enzyme